MPSSAAASDDPQFPNPITATPRRIFILEPELSFEQDGTVTIANAIEGQLRSGIWRDASGAMQPQILQDVFFRLALVCSFLLGIATLRIASGGSPMGWLPEGMMIR